MLNVLGKAKKAFRFISMIKGAHWIKPSDSGADPDCAIMEFDLQLPRDYIGKLAMVTTIAKQFDPRVEADHKVFKYMDRQYRMGNDAHITVTLSIRETEIKKHWWERFG